MTTSRLKISSTELTLAALTLLAVALIEPVLLYFISLLLFGLPHVLTELAFVRRRFRPRAGKLFWYAVACLIFLEAALRLGGKLTGLSNADLGMLELLVLAGLIASVLLLSRAEGQTAWARLLAVVFAGGIGMLLYRGEILSALMLLALLHNFTPLAFVTDLAREDTRLQSHTRTMWLVFVLPLLAGLTAWYWQPAVWMPGWHSDFMAKRFMAQISGDWFNLRLQIAILTAAALAQCLHYYAVIRWLPALLPAGTNDWLPTRWIYTILSASFALSLLFVLDYKNARWLYGAAAGVHAWLEWPLLVLIVSGWRVKSEGFPMREAYEQ